MFSIRSRFAMSFMRRLATLGLIAIGSTITACSSEGPTSPASDVSVDASHSLVSTVQSVLAPVTAVTGLLWNAPVTELTASKVIGSNGGTLALSNGMTLTVPKGAVSSNITFSVRRLPGVIVAYDFQPHGTKFAVPLVIEQPTRSINLLNLTSSSNVRAAYFTDNNLLNQLAGIALVQEFRPTVLTPDRSMIRFTVDHFSGYMVSMD